MEEPSVSASRWQQSIFSKDSVSAQRERVVQQRVQEIRARLYRRTFGLFLIAVFGAGALGWALGQLFGVIVA